MKVLIGHNSYQQRGGEDGVVIAESRLLESNGHSVVPYRRHNDELLTGHSRSSVGFGIQSVWSTKSFQDLKTLIAREKPDIAHFHNVFPLISPAAYYACAKARVP